MFPDLEGHAPDDVNDGAPSFEEIENALRHDDGLAAQQHLAAGRAVYYADERYPGEVIRLFPDGRRQIVSVDAEGVIGVVRDL